MINTAVPCLLSSHIKASAKRDMTEDCKDCSPSEVSSETASSQGASSKRRPPETSSAHLRTICLSADGPLFPNTGKSSSASLNCREDRCLCFKAGTETVVHAQRRKRSLFLSREAPPKKDMPSCSDAGRNIGAGQSNMPVPFRRQSIMDFKSVLFPMPFFPGTARDVLLFQTMRIEVGRGHSSGITFILCAILLIQS